MKKPKYRTEGIGGRNKKLRAEMMKPLPYELMRNEIKATMKIVEDMRKEYEPK